MSQSIPLPGSYCGICVVWKKNIVSFAFSSRGPKPICSDCVNKNTHLVCCWCGVARFKYSQHDTCMWQFLQLHNLFIEGGSELVRSKGICNTCGDANCSKYLAHVCYPGRSRVDRAGCVDFLTLQMLKKGVSSFYF